MRFALLISLVAVSVSLAGVVFAQSTADLPPSAQMLLRYDANHDGVITKDELEAGLKADFAAADTDGDGTLNRAEASAENDRRLGRDGPQAAPVRDWNYDGVVDFNEFANAARSYFTLLDRAKDGRVTIADLRQSGIPTGPAVSSRLQAPIEDRNYNPADSLPGTSP